MTARTIPDTTPRLSKKATDRLRETVDGTRRALERARAHLARLNAYPVPPADAVRTVEMDVARLAKQLAEAEARLGAAR